MKTSELIGLSLDWAVVKCECAIPAAFKSIPALLNGSVRVFRGDISSYSEPVSPSTNWAHGGPIIEREEIAILLEYPKSWWATDGDVRSSGDTPLIAAMRCYVTSKLGDDVEIPEELK